MPIIRSVGMREGGAVPGGGGGATYDQTGITSTGSLSNGSVTGQVGWRFTVGASDLEVGRLRVLSGNLSPDETVRVWRVSDQSKIAEVDITPGNNTWAEEALASPVTLSAGQDYIVTMAASDGSGRSYKIGIPGNQTFHAGLTFVAGYYKADAAFPTGSGNSGSIWGLPDIMFAS